MAESDRNNHIAPDDLSAYADGEVRSAAEREEIARHLANCEPCREELAELQAISQLLAEMPEPDVPRSFRLSPEDVADASRGPAPIPIQPWLLRHQSTFRVAAMAAAVLLALIVTIDLLPGQGDDTEEAAFDEMDQPEQDLAQDEAAEDEVVEEEDAEDADEPAAGESGGDEEAAIEEAPAEDEAAEEEPDADVSGGADDDASSADEDTAAPETESEESESEEAVQDEAEPAPDEAQDGTESAGEEGPDEPMSAADDAPESEGDEDVVSEPVDPAETDQVRTADEAGVESQDDGLSTLRLVAIALAVLTVLLAAAGFLLPRWWQSSSRP